MSAFEGYCGRAPTRSLTLSSTSKRLRHVEGDDRDEAGREAALRDEGDGGIRGERLDAVRAGDVLGEIEIVGPRRERGLSDHRGEIERRRTEHRELAVEELDELQAVADIDSDSVDALVAVAGGENLGGAVHQGDIVVAGGGEQLGDCRADLAGSDHDDVLHAFSGRSSGLQGIIPKN